MTLRKHVHLNLGRIILIQLSMVGLTFLLVRYDLRARTPWVLHPTVSRILGWLVALYGLFWIMWWFFWVAIEGGEEYVELYNVTWAPVTTGFSTEGPFEWCRYPLAFGYWQFLWGIGFLVQSTTIVLKVVPVAVILTIIYLLLVPERRKLAEHGEEYREYRRDTPLFIPRIPSTAKLLHIFNRRKRNA